MKVTLVAGPPCGGKTTYVQDRMESGDVLLDFDRMANAVSGEEGHDHPGSTMAFARQMFKAAVRYGAKRPFDDSRLWIIRGAPERMTRQDYRRQYPGLSVVVLATPAEVCKERAAGSRPDAWGEYIDGWWQRYEPDDSDEVIA